MDFTRSETENNEYARITTSTKDCKLTCKPRKSREGRGASARSSASASLSNFGSSDFGSSDFGSGNFGSSDFGSGNSISGLQSSLSEFGSRSGSGNFDSRSGSGNLRSGLKPSLIDLDSSGLGSGKNKGNKLRLGLERPESLTRTNVGDFNMVSPINSSHNVIQKGTNMDEGGGISTKGRKTKGRKTKGRKTKRKKTKRRKH